MTRIQYSVRPLGGFHSKDKFVVWRLIIGGLPEMVTRTRTGNQPRLFDSALEAQKEAIKQIEHDRSACTRLGLKFETDQTSYFLVQDTKK